MLQRGVSQESDSTSLVRTLGFWPTFMIGTGTMLGAGFFIFPGLAGARTGAGAALSFAIGGTIAFIVAMSAAQLATSMPHSGGVINFAERSVGDAAASLLGLAQWAGLTFASAFYLMGFGEYTTEMFRESGFFLPSYAPLAIALGAGVFLSIIALFNTSLSGQIQKYLVVFLLLGIFVFLAVAIGSPLSGSGESRSVDVTPNGVRPIFTTAALVFTSYLGFVQIANVAGDVINPNRNLPRAILGSVVLATALYILVVIATTLTFSPNELADKSETAVASVAKIRLGATGQFGMLVAGLLATLSSANASILSSSRTILALGRRRALPDHTSRISPRYGTPQVALIYASLPVLGLLFYNELSVFAEAASVLHLIIYAAISWSVLSPKNKTMGEGSFQMVGSPALPIIGGLACLGLCYFMSTTSLIASAFTAASALLFWLVYSRRRQVFHEDEFAGPEEETE